MDNFTHTVTAAAMSRAGLDRYSPYAAWLLVLGANAPDVDVFLGIGSGVRYLDYHRGFTHSLVAAPLMAAAVVGAVRLFHQRFRKDQPFPVLPAMLLALSGVLSHLLMDFATPYGIRLLLPFSGRWLAWDMMPVLDVWLLPAMLAGMVLPFLFRMVSDEIGARRGSLRPGAIFALVFLLAWGFLRDFSHRRAAALLDSRIYHNMEPRRVSAYPDMANPFLWHGVVDTGSTLELADVRLFEEFDPTHTRTYFPPDPQPALEVARKTRAARVFLDFAVYPYIYVDRKEEGYEVVFRDLRYDAGTLAPHGAVARVLMNERLEVLREDFHFRDPDPVR